MVSVPAERSSQEVQAVLPKAELVVSKRRSTGTYTLLQDKVGWKIAKQNERPRASTGNHNDIQIFIQSAKTNHCIN